jgi:hypothetical protein
MSSQIENLVTSCPQCNSLVGLPSIMSLDAQVRCPVCQHKYTLRSRLPQQIPQLELVLESEEADDDSGRSLAIDPMAKLEVSEILRKNAKLSRRRRHRRSHRDGERNAQDNPQSSNPDNLALADADTETSFADFQAATAQSTSHQRRHRSGNAAGESTAVAHSSTNGETAQLQTAGELAAYASRTARHSSSRRRPTVNSSKKSGQWVEIGKVILGALLALPVAQLIIWWVLSVDPLQLAPAVAKVVPFAVPAKVLEAEQDQ